MGKNFSSDHSRSRRTCSKNHFPQLNFRRVYIRLIRKGQVLDHHKNLSDYLKPDDVPTDAAPAAPASPSTSASTAEDHNKNGLPIFVLKNVPTGQQEIPLLQTNATGAAVGGANPLQPNPFAGGPLFGAPGGPGAQQNPFANPLFAQLLRDAGGPAPALGGGGPPIPPGGMSMGGAGGGSFGAPGAGFVGRPARERYAQQLQQLRDMGFHDEERCLQVLDDVDGNIDRALDMLFG